MPSASATQVPLTTTQNKRRRGQKQTLQAFLKKPEPTFHDHWVPNWVTCRVHRHDCNCPAYKGFSIHRIQLITLKCTACHYYWMGEPRAICDNTDVSRGVQPNNPCSKPR